MNFLACNKMFFSFKNQAKTMDFTHFISLPFFTQKIRLDLRKIQSQILSEIDNKHLEFCIISNPNLFHLTLCMLSLKDAAKKAFVKKIFEENNEKLANLLNLKNFRLNFNKITCFSENNPEYKRANDVIFLEPDPNEYMSIIHEISHLLIKDLMKFEIIDSASLKTSNLIEDERGRIRMNRIHLTLVRIKNTYKIPAKYLVEKLREEFKGIEIPVEFLDVSTRFEYDENKFYKSFFRRKILEEKTE